MDCRELEKNLSRYYDGEMQADEARQVELHLADCLVCSQELAEFRNLSRLLNSYEASASESPTVATWSAIEQRLDSQVALPRNARTWRRAAIATVLALAALVLVMFSWNYYREAATTREIAIDLSDVVQRFASNPVRGLESLTDQYAGQDVPTGDAVKLVGFAPRVAQSLPANTQLVSTRILSLPVCVCKQGQCTCGPGGCNCVAALCQRTDGSQFLVLEHCESKRVTFGGAPVRMVKHARHQISMLGQEGALAASWQSKAQRLTAIGLRSQAEAESLVDAMESDASSG